MNRGEENYLDEEVPVPAMPRETEAKILEVAVCELTGKLEELGAEKLFDGKVETVFFDFPDHRLTRTGRLLRLRTLEDKLLLTFKGAIEQEGKAKVREELELELKDQDTMRSILLELGLEELGHSGKHRISYLLRRPGDDSVRLEIDTLPGIPSFLEIEADSYGVIEEMALELGFSKSEIRPWSTTDVLKFYRKLNLARDLLKEQKES